MITYNFSENTGTGFNIGDALGKIGADILGATGDLISGGAELLLADWKRQSQMDVFNLQTKAQIELLNLTKEIEKIKASTILTEAEKQIRLKELEAEKIKLENKEKTEKIILLTSIIGISGIVLYILFFKKGKK